MRRLVHLAVLLAACGGAAEAPPRYRFEAGDVRRYALTVETFPVGRGGGETVTATAGVVETVEAVDGDGIATIRVEIGASSAPLADDLPVPFAPSSAPRTFRVLVRPDGQMSGGGDAPLWFLPTLPPSGQRVWDEKTAFGRTADVVWHYAGRHEITGTVGPSTAIRTAAVLLGDRHPPGSYVLHEPGTGCPSCEIVSDGRGLGTTLVDLRGGAVREAAHEWVVRVADPGPGRVARVLGWRISLVRLD